jgi:hypothetical protein
MADGTGPIHDPAAGSAPPLEPGPIPGIRSDRVDAKRFILWLFVALALATAGSLWLFVHTPAGAPHHAVVYRAMAGDLAAPVVAWFLLSGIASKGTERWFWFLGAAPAGLMAMAATFLLLRLTGAL